jgi:hypothetical protein
MRDLESIIVIRIIDSTYCAGMKAPLEAQSGRRDDRTEWHSSSRQSYFNLQSEEIEMRREAQLSKLP